MRGKWILIPAILFFLVSFVLPLGKVRGESFLADGSRSQKKEISKGEAAVIALTTVLTEKYPDIQREVENARLQQEARRAYSFQFFYEKFLGKDLQDIIEWYKQYEANGGITVEDNDRYKSTIRLQKGNLNPVQLNHLTNSPSEVFLYWTTNTGFHFQAKITQVIGYQVFFELNGNQSSFDLRNVSIDGTVVFDVKEKNKGKLELFFKDKLTGDKIPFVNLFEISAFGSAVEPSAADRKAFTFSVANGTILTLPAEQNIKFEVSKDGYEPTSFEVTLEDGEKQTLTIELKKRVNISGLVADKQGRGLNKSNILFSSQDPARSVVIAGPRGDYRASDIVPNDNNEVLVKAMPPDKSGCKPTEQSKLIAIGEENEYTVNFQFNCAVTVSGKITDTLGNKGVNNAQVGIVSKLFNGWTTSTNDVKEDGSYTLKDVPTGLTTININPWSYERFENRRCVPSSDSRELTLEAEKEYKDVDFQFKCIPTTATISGKAVNGEGQPLGGIYIMVNGINYGATNNASAKKGEYLAKGVPAGEIKINAVSPGSRIEQCAVSPENYTITVRESDENKEYTGKDFVVKCAVAAAATTTTTTAVTTPPRPTMIRPIPTTTPPPPPWWDLIWRRIRGL